MTRYTEGFSHFVTSMTAPVASSWSDRRVGLAPTGKAPPYHGVSDTARDEVGLCLKSGIGASLTNEIYRYPVTLVPSMLAGRSALKLYWRTADN